VDDELEEIWNEAVVAKALSRKLLGETEENKNLSEDW
jgi:hypothetical protein